ncbi:tetratricopeptide repeat protein [Candidatus Neomarinimicrobiota bacterium]
MALPSRRVVIAIALRSANYKSQRVIDATLSRIKDRLDAIGLLKTIKIVVIGNDIFSTSEQAERYIKKRKYFLVIHGTVYAGNIENVYRYDMSNFFFSYLTGGPTKESPQFNVLRRDIEMMLTTRDWIISESNDILDIEKVSQELLDSSLSIFSITLAYSLQYCEIAIELITYLLREYERSVPKGKRKIEVSKDKKKLRVPLNLLKSGRLRVILREIYIGLIRHNIAEEEYRKAINLAKSGMSVGAEPIRCYPGMALAEYYLGNMKRAKEYTNKINEIEPNTPIYLVNSAFFSITEKDYASAVAFYDQLRKIHSENGDLIFDVIAFLSERYFENSNEIGYKYGEGILTYHYVDEQRGREILLDFIAKASGHEEYASMRVSAEKCLGNE